MRVPEKCISALDTHSEDRGQGSDRNRVGIDSVISYRLVPRVRGRAKAALLILFLTVIMSVSFINTARSELLDRVVAVVNSEVILFSELQDAVEKSKAAGDERSESEILEQLINRTLLLERALKFRVEMETYILDETEERKLIDDYITRRIKAFIHIPFEEIENYYLSHRDDFGDRDLYEAWDDVENRLRSERVRVKIDDHILQLRKQASIRVQLENE